MSLKKKGRRRGLGMKEQIDHVATMEKLKTKMSEHCKGFCKRKRAGRQEILRIGYK